MTGDETRCRNRAARTASGWFGRDFLNLIYKDALVFLRKKNKITLMLEAKGARSKISPKSSFGLRSEDDFQGHTIRFTFFYPHQAIRSVFLPSGWGRSLPG